VSQLLQTAIAAHWSPRGGERASSTNTIDEIEPMAFINGAIEYQTAAHRLHALCDEPTKGREGLDPVYFLYFHSLELAFKGYLRVQGRTTKELAETRMGHRLSSLLAERTQLISLLDVETRRSLQNVVSLLENSNRSQGPRYFTLNSRIFPELQWTRDVIQELVQTAKSEVIKLERSASTKGPAARLDFTVGKPRPKN